MKTFKKWVESREIYSGPVYKGTRPRCNFCGAPTHRWCDVCSEFCCKKHREHIEGSRYMCVACLQKAYKGELSQQSDKDIEDPDEYILKKGWHKESW